MKPTEGFSHQKNTFKALGIWKIDFKNEYLNALYRLYGIITRSIQAAFVLSQIFALFVVEDVMAATEALYLTLLTLNITFKIYNFTLHFDRIHNLYKKLDYELFAPTSEIEKQYVSTAIRRSRILNFIMTGMGFLSFFGTTVFVLRDLKHPKIMYRCNYIFFDVEKHFWVAFSHQMVACSICIFLNFGLDTFLVGLFLHFNAIIQSLAYRLSQIGFEEYKITEDDKKKCLTVPDLDKDIHLYFQMDRIKAYIDRVYLKKGSVYAQLLKAVMLHEIIYKCCRELEQISSGFMFTQLIATVFIFCTTAMQLISTPISVEFASKVLYANVVLSELWLACWTGNDITYNSSELARKAFECNILKLDKQTSQLLLMFMQRNFFPIELRVGLIIKITLNMSNFVAILRTSYSYFAVMRSTKAGT